MPDNSRVLSLIMWVSIFNSKNLHDRCLQMTAMETSTAKFDKLLFWLMVVGYGYWFLTRGNTHTHTKKRKKLKKNEFHFNMHSNCFTHTHPKNRQLAKDNT